MISAIKYGLNPDVFDQLDVFIAPPYLYLSHARSIADRLLVVSQNVSRTEIGAFTGEICSSMLVDSRIDGSLVGHSERRALYGETSQIVAEKTVQLSKLIFFRNL